MVNNPSRDDNLEASISSLHGDDMIGGGLRNIRDPKERLWHSMTVLDSCPSATRPQEMLPLRPGSRTHRGSASSVGSSSKGLHGQRGHLRPDGWIGRKNTRRSWRVKSISDVSSMVSSGEEGATEDTCSVETPRSAHTFHAGMLPRGGQDATFKNARCKTKNDEEHGKIPDMVHPPDIKQEEKGHQASLDGGSMHSILTEDSRSRISDARDMWNSLSSSIDKNVLPRVDHQQSKIGKIVKIPPAAISHMQELDKEGKCNDIPEGSAKSDEALPRHNITPRNSSSTATSEDQSLPELEMSLTSLDMSMGSSEGHQSETDRMWTSVGSMEAASRPDEMLPLRPSSIKRRSGGRNNASATQHNFRALNRPDEWLGGSPRSQPSKRRSWTVKRIIESDMENS